MQENQELFENGNEEEIWTEEQQAELERLSKEVCTWLESLPGAGIANSMLLRHKVTRKCEWLYVGEFLHPDDPDALSKIPTDYELPG